MYSLLVFHQFTEQVAFRKTYFTIDHLHTINQIIENGLEYEIELYLAFMDLKKAFDSIKHEGLIKVLQNQNLLLVINNLYAEIKT